MLFHKDPKKVMVLGLASGITAGEVLNYPVEQLDVIDINEQVVEASDFFVPWNNNVLKDPRTNMILQDGRAHLNLTKNRYDVIISEPSNPWMAGLAALFTKDFFDLASKRLNDDGIFVQFIHSYQMDWETFALVGRTFATVFPNNLLVSTSPSTLGHDYLLVGFKGTEKLNREYARSKLPYAEKSGNIELHDTDLLYRLILTEDLGPIFGQGAVNTDSRPRLEFIAPKLIYNDDSRIFQEINSKRLLSSKTMDIVSAVAADVSSQIDFADYAFSVFAPFPEMVDLEKADQVQKEKFLSLLDRYCINNSIQPSEFRDNYLISRCREIQRAKIDGDSLNLPDKGLSYFYLGNLYQIDNRLDESIACYSKSLLSDPDNHQAHYQLGILLQKKGDFEGAAKQYADALRLKPDSADIFPEMGAVLVRQGKYDEAESWFEKALLIQPGSAAVYADQGLNYLNLGKLEKAIDAYDKALHLSPDNPQILNDSAVVLLRLGMLSDAVMRFRNVLGIRPDWADPMNNLAWILAVRDANDIAEHLEAVNLAERACELTDNMRPDFLDTLAVAYASAGRFSDAVGTGEKAIDLARSSGNGQLAAEIEDRLSLFKAGKIFVE
jgi:spermidine synthase